MEDFSFTNKRGGFLGWRISYVEDFFVTNKGGGFPRGGFPGWRISRGGNLLHCTIDYCRFVV